MAGSRGREVTTYRDRLPRRADALTLEQHDDLLRAAVTLAGGSVFNHAGDRSVGCRRPDRSSGRCQPPSVGMVMRHAAANI